MIGDMARIKLSPFVTDIRGKLKGGLIFSSNQHGNMVHLRKPVSMPVSESQQTQRTAFQDAINAWHDLDDATKAQYHVQARVQGVPNGINLFISSQLGGAAGGGVIEEVTLTIIVPFDGSQDSGRLPVGGSSGFYNFRYTFDVLADGMVRIATSGGQDPILWLDDSSGIEVASDDDGGGGLESLIEIDLTVGTYTLQVGNYGSFGDGNVDITGFVGNIIQVDP